MKQLIATCVVGMLLVACHSNTQTSEEKIINDSIARAPGELERKKEERNKETAIASVMAFGRHDTAGVFKAAAANFVDYGDGSFPPVKGKDSVTASIAIFIKAFSDIHVRDITAISEGDSVAVFAQWIGTFKNPLMGIPPTGITTILRDCDVYEFNKAGRITSHRATQNVSQYLRKK